MVAMILTQISGFHYHVGDCFEWGHIPFIEEVKDCLVENDGVTFSQAEAQAQKAIQQIHRLCDAFALVADEHLRFRLYVLQARQNSIHSMGGSFCHALRLADSKRLNLRFIRSGYG